MADEFTINSINGLTFYGVRWQTNGNVFLTDGSSDETWGTGGRDADDYDVQMTEEDASGHYIADFDASGNITTAGLYKVAVFRQAGANPADVPTDVPVFQGEIEWDGSAEVTLRTITGAIGQVHTVEDESPGGGAGGGAPATTSGITEGC
jgi:hypothetical protein